MSLYIHFVCDEPHDAPMRPSVQSLKFDSLVETFGDLLAGVRALGWVVDVDAKCNVQRCRCPDHVR